MCGKGSTPLPVDLLKGDMSAAEKKQRRESEIDFGEREWKMPRTLHGRREAQKKWRKIVKLYNDSDLAVVGKADEEALERYCLTYEEYYDLLSAREVIVQKYQNDPEAKVMALHKTKIDTQIAVKMSILNKLDAVLLLTPVAKIHTRPVPRLHRKKEDPKQATASKFNV
jgi:phage terminase small subunit